jgi:membrane protein implicated in regulation of membrane protease activity
MQSKTGSLIEAALNIGSGFFIAMIVWQVVAGPWFGYDISFGDNFALTSLFTGISLVRSYLWRRYFNWRHKCT